MTSRRVVAAFLVVLMTVMMLFGFAGCRDSGTPGSGATTGGENSEESVSSVETEKDTHEISAADRTRLNETFLKSICYYGNRSKCVMPKEMAEAYGAVIKGLPQIVSNEGTSGQLHVMLADPNNDGMPILITSYLDTENKFNVDENGNCYLCGEKDYGSPCTVNRKDGLVQSIYVYGFDGKKAVKVDYPWVDYGNGFGTYNGIGALINEEFHHDAGNERIIDIYTVENGRVTLAKQVKEYIVIAHFFSDGDNEDAAYGDLPKDAKYTIEDINKDISILVNDGWAQSVSEYYGNMTYSWVKIYENGKNKTSKYYDMKTGEPLKENVLDEVYGAKYKDKILCVSDESYHTTYNMTASANAVQYLLEYGKALGEL